MGGKKHGFTLLELIAVLAIIAILAGLGVKNYSLARRQAKESRAKAGIEKLRNLLNEYRVEYGRYPATLFDIGPLTNAVEGVEWIDPWGSPYQYECTDRHRYRIWSEGQDPDTADDNIDPSKPGY